MKWASDFMAVVSGLSTDVERSPYVGDPIEAETRGHRLIAQYNPASVR